ncbi:related to GRAM domain-containing protein 2 [Phialocephala subalpina]|uniref:Related to GRAM domain-containing protein 2 n=1 Tax=Phialocephala subalpina TaxID=576137 RepID=A0A1L7XKP6_9HELO|nr:related to GRAM domain-containing protein 2 [Phialocephala subalpina]
MSFTIERSQSPPRNGLSQMFSKSRRDRKGKDAISTKSSSSDGLGVRASIEDAIDKLKAGDDDGESNGIKKLVPKGIGSKRRQKRQEREEEQRQSEEAARGRSVAERGTLENDVEGVVHHSSGDGSSLITNDSETESPLETPPPLQTHPAHIGYLTTSSPLVHSTTVPEISLHEAQLDGAPTPRASTFPVVHLDNLAASASAPSLVDTTLQAPTHSSSHRSPSPVGRLKKALTLKRDTSPSPNTSPERKAGGGGAAGLKEKERGSTAESRRGSVASRVGNIFVERQASPQSSTVSSPERPQTAKIQTIDTSAPPSTPPSSENPAPIIVNTPPTPTETSSPRFSSNRDRGPPDPIKTNTNVVTSPSGNMISHRRMRSGSQTLVPSKLSNITSAPLTPTLESGATTPSSGGFFSSVFSAAQNAANTLSNSIANTSVAPGNRSRSSTHDLKEIESPVVETFAEKSESEDPTEEKELAVKTLGMGDLSLSALGISEPSSGTDSPAKPLEEARGRSDTNDEARSTAALPASANGNVDIDDLQPLVRPRSMYEPAAGEQTPPNGSVFEGKTGIHRSGSIRSAIGKRRKRGSSAATGTTIGAAIAAANTSLANPHAGTTKITGFAVASKKRNRDFHQLFRSVPDDDYLIEDYSCALQREILAHGRLYVSEGHLCFSSNIFGWVTTLVMSFDEIVSVEKRSTALVFKNGLMISTLHAKNIFASFTSRDSTYDLIVGIWKLGHPSLRSSLNGVRIEETGGGDKTEKDDGVPVLGSQSGSESDSEGEEGDEIYDEDEDGEDGMSFSQAEGSVAGSDIAEKVVSRKPSAAVVPNGITTEKGQPDGPTSPAGDYPGPATHAPTDCTDQETHYAKVIGDDIIAAPLGKVWSLMFGPASVTWMRNWLTVEQKCLELTMEDKRPLGLDNKVRNYSYIKPLNGAIGPKQTKCICVETLDSLDLEKAVSVTISTQTPDVPSGNVFSVKTKYCMSWAEGNTTRLQMNCAIEWTGKSWLKGPIEKGANDGQVQYAKDIVASLKAAVSSRRGTVVAVGGKGKKKGRKGRQSNSLAKQSDGTSETKSTTEDWGLLEPVRGIFGPLVDIVKPLLTGNILYGLLVGLLVASWFGFGFPGKGRGRNDLGGLSYFGTPERVAAYEEIWRREESELWEWLEDRVGTDRLRDVGKMPIEAQAINEKIKDEKMDEREIDAAIRVTEEKLRVLKASIEKMKKKAENSKSKVKEVVQEPEL